MTSLTDLADSDGIIAECSRIDSRRRLQVIVRGWGQAMLGISPKPPLQDAGWYFDSWDFPTREAALFALETWNPERSPEPQGWHRHATTGRFRIGGKKSLEYVKDAPGESIEEQVAYAIKVTQGQEYVVREIEEDPDGPDGLKHFGVITENQGQQHYFGVFYYCGRYVVIPSHDIHVNEANVEQRLTDPWPNP